MYWTWERMERTAKRVAAIQAKATRGRIPLEAVSVERQMQKPLKKNYLQDPDGPRLTSRTEPFGDVNQSSE